MEDWDLEEIYDGEIAPLMAQIIALCKLYEMPMIASFNYRRGSFCTTALHFDGRETPNYENAQAALLRGTTTRNPNA